MSLALLLHYLMFNMFRVLIHPSSGACDLFVELFHGLYCSGTMCVGVTLWFGWGGVVSLAGFSLLRIQHQHTSYQSNTTHEITQQISRKLLRMDVLTPETCWTNNEVIKQVTSSWSLYSTAYGRSYRDLQEIPKHPLGKDAHFLNITVGGTHSLLALVLCILIPQKYVSYKICKTSINKFDITLLHCSLRALRYIKTPVTTKKCTILQPM